VVGAVAALIIRLGVVGNVIDTVLAAGFMVGVFLRARPNRVDASSLEAEVMAAGAAVQRVKGKRKDPRGAAV
jgi:PiT family inorganic phosphate transporter